jgi:hypothetical protein
VIEEGKTSGVCTELEGRGSVGEVKDVGIFTGFTSETSVVEKDDEDENDDEEGDVVNDGDE